MAAIDDDDGNGNLLMWENDIDSNLTEPYDSDEIESDDQLSEDEFEKQQVEEFDEICRAIFDIEQIPFDIIQLIVCEYCRPTLLLWDPDYCSWGAPSREYLSRVDFPYAAARSRARGGGGRMRVSQRKRIAVGMHEFEAGYKYEIKMRLVCGNGQHPFTSVGVIPHDFTFISSKDLNQRYVEKPFFWRDFRGQDCDISLDFTQQTMSENGGRGTVKFAIIADVPRQSYFEFQTPANFVKPPVKIFTTWSSGGGWARIDEVYEERDDDYIDSEHAGMYAEHERDLSTLATARLHSFRVTALDFFEDLSKQRTFKFVFLSLYGMMLLQIGVWLGFI